MEGNLLQQFQRSLEDLLANDIDCDKMAKVENLLDDIQKMYGQQVYEGLNKAYVLGLIARYGQEKPCSDYKGQQR